MRTATLILWYVCMFVCVYTNTQPNGVLITLQSFKNQTLLSKLERAPLLVKPLVNTVSSLSGENVICFYACAQPDVRMFKNTNSAFTQLHILLCLSK